MAVTRYALRVNCEFSTTLALALNGAPRKLFARRGALCTEGAELLSREAKSGARTASRARLSSSPRAFRQSR